MKYGKIVNGMCEDYFSEDEDAILDKKKGTALTLRILNNGMRGMRHRLGVMC